MDKGKVVLTELGRQLLERLNHYWKTASIPAFWHEGTLQVFSKNGTSKGTVKEGRPINVGSHLKKIWEKILLSKMNKILPHATAVTKY